MRSDVKKKTPVDGRFDSWCRAEAKDEAQALREAYAFPSTLTWRERRYDAFLVMERRMISQIAFTVLLLSSIGALLPSLAHGDDSKRDWWRGSRREPYWEQLCEVKIESKPGEFKREVKCKGR